MDAENSISYILGQIFSCWINCGFCICERARDEETLFRTYMMFDTKIYFLMGCSARWCIFRLSFFFFRLYFNKLDTVIVVFSFGYLFARHTYCALESIAKLNIPLVWLITSINSSTDCRWHSQHVWKVSYVLRLQQENCTSTENAFALAHTHTHVCIDNIIRLHSYGMQTIIWSWQAWGCVIFVRVNAFRFKSSSRWYGCHVKHFLVSA